MRWGPTVLREAREAKKNDSDGLYISDGLYLHSTTLSPGFASLSTASAASTSMDPNFPATFFSDFPCMVKSKSQQ